MILLIDNYDSFTFNLYQAIAGLGAEVEVVRNDQVTVDDIERRIDKIDGVVISPGPCTPNEAGISVDLVDRLSGSTPILGVCLGHQSIGAAFGAEIIHAPELRHGKTSLVRHDGQGVYAGLPNPFIATRYHSLIIDPETIPPEFTVTATSDDGVVMGVRHREKPVEGVQFHPESILTTSGDDLLANFLRMCGAIPNDVPEEKAVGY
jgi:anthranilate synthase/aminodeoxychorismate synthase-like glutamine amidotransferase